MNLSKKQAKTHTSNKVDEISIDFKLLSLINKQIRLLIGDEHYG